MHVAWVAGKPGGPAAAGANMADRFGIGGLLLGGGQAETVKNLRQANRWNAIRRLAGSATCDCSPGNLSGIDGNRWCVRGGLRCDCECGFIFQRNEISYAIGC